MGREVSMSHLLKIRNTIDLGGSTGAVTEIGSTEGRREFEIVTEE